MEHDINDLIAIFNQCFEQEYNTKLVKGGDEPLYVPANDTCPYNAIYFARGFYSSGLHEIAHWLVAGKERRKLEDFGYWYEPDGRTEEQQRLFEQVEVKPQALEWILATAANFRYLPVPITSMVSPATPNRLNSPFIDKCNIMPQQACRNVPKHSVRRWRNSMVRKIPLT